MQIRKQRGRPWKPPDARSRTGTTHCPRVTSTSCVQHYPATSMPTSPSWAAASPGSGRPTTSPSATRRLRIVVLEKEFAGFGASGRNGGWASGLPAHRLGADSSGVVARSDASPPAGGRREHRRRGQSGQPMRASTVTSPRAGTCASPRRRCSGTGCSAQLAHAREWDRTEDDLALLDRNEARGRINADGVFGGLYTPHCAAIHPARMVRGLARPSSGSASRSTKEPRSPRSSRASCGTDSR